MNIYHKYQIWALAYKVESQKKRSVMVLLSKLSLGMKRLFKKNDEGVSPTLVQRFWDFLITSFHKILK